MKSITTFLFATFSIGIVRACAAPLTITGTATTGTTITGTVTTKSGLPLAGTTLYMLDLPGSQSFPDLADQATVVTDAKGRFSWTVTKELARSVPIPTDAKVEAPRCFTLGVGLGWNTTVTPATGRKARDSVREVFSEAARPCETRWTQVGDHPKMAIVAPDIGAANFVLRVPGGAPLASHKVQFVETGTFSSYAGSVVYHGFTNPQGQLHLQLVPGLRQLSLFVPGIGSGSTGSVEIVANKTASHWIPPLAPFAAVSGKVPPALFKPGASVTFNGDIFGRLRWYNPVVTPDGNGAFVLNDLLPGRYRLTLTDGAQSADPVPVVVQPGQTLTGIEFTPRRPGTQRGLLESFQSAATKDSPKQTMSGHVLDTAGAPVANADVFAICSYQGAIRQYQQVLSAKTDLTGTYLITGIPGSSMWPANVALVAAAADHPLATSRPIDPASETARPGRGTAPANLVGDIIIPDGHPELTVQVLFEGKPAPDIWVRLKPESGTGLFSNNYVGSMGSEARQIVDDRLRPTGRTGADGTVRFIDLAPGLWTVLALKAPNAGDLERLGDWSSGTGPETIFNISRSVPVDAKAPSRFSLNIYPQVNSIEFTVAGAGGLTGALPGHLSGGLPLASQNVGFEFGQLPNSGYSGGYVELDANGKAHYSMGRPGLWRIRTRLRDSELHSFPLSTEPYYEGNQLFALTPAQPRKEVIPIHVKRYEPGRIRVRLLDAAGRPATGSVYFGTSEDSVQYGASVNAKIHGPDLPGGEALFADLPSGRYLVKANLASGLSTPPKLDEGKSMPSDASLTGLAMTPVQSVTVRSGEETQVTFKPELYGYVRGKLVIPGPQSGYAGVSCYDEKNQPIPVRFDQASGEFIAGPFRPGLVKFNAYFNPPSTETPRLKQDFTVQVDGGKVSHATFTMTPPLNAAQEPVALQGDKTVKQRELTPGGWPLRPTSLSVGAVMMPDGVTPAWGARALLFTPDNWQPVRSATADAQGKLFSSTQWYTSEGPVTPPPGSPTETVWVVWLPGANGATVLDSTNGIDRVVLPPAVSLQGRLTVGGESIASLGSSFQVVASYQGRGKLNGVLSVSAAVQADGSFKLSGLTPGSYTVQASRDGAFLSVSKPLLVTAGVLPSMSIDIAPPGARLRLHVVDRAEKPLVGVNVKLNRPAGALADDLWPASLETDSSGDLFIEGLEAGEHKFQIGKQTVTVTLPVFQPEAPSQVETVVIDD